MKVAFHSYKGGVGRTKIMVAVGALLAMKGHRVGMLDFDLDASSLATIFRADAGGLEDRHLLQILARRDPSMVIDAMQDVTPFLIERFGRSPLGNGCLKYIPTIPDPNIADDIIYRDPMVFTVRRILETSIQAGGVDTLLLDLRPGYSRVSAVVFPCVDKAVVVTRLDRSNIEGLRVVVPHMVAQNLEPIVVANMVPEDPRTEGRLRDMREAIGRDIMVCINYDPTLVFDDDIEAVAAGVSPFTRGLEFLVRLLNLGE